MSAANTAHAYREKWLAAVRSTSGLTADDKRVAAWLAGKLEAGAVVHKSWQQMRNELKLPNFAAGVHLTALSRAGFVGERVRTGPSQGFPLVIPFSEPKSGPTITSSTTRADLEALNAKRAAARRAANARADAKWLASK